MTKALKLFLGFVFLILIGVDVVLGAAFDTDYATCTKQAAANPGYVLTINCTATSSIPTPTPPTTPAPVPSTDTCTAQGLRNTVANLDWGGGHLKAFSMQENESYSFPLGEIVAGAGGQISTVYGGVQKVISISTEKCDFTQTLETKRCLVGGNDPGLNYSSNKRNFFACILTPGVTYYVNIRNAVLNGNYPARPIVDACTSGVCQFSAEY